MQFDILDYLAMAPKSKGLPFCREEWGLGNANDIVTEIDPKTGYGQWKHIKSPDGFAWDIRLYSEFGVYDWITEKTWDDGPRFYKKFVQNHAHALPVVADPKDWHDGLKMCDRYYNQTLIQGSVLTPAERTSFRIFDNCVWDGQPHNLGDVLQLFDGPFMIDSGGDVGMQPTVIQSYAWNGDFKKGLFGMVEENWYVLNYGWTRWAEKKWNGQRYVITLNSKGSPNLTVTNKLVKRPPKINFPCF